MALAVSRDKRHVQNRDWNASQPQEPRDGEGKHRPRRPSPAVSSNHSRAREPDSPGLPPRVLSSTVTLNSLSLLGGHGSSPAEARGRVDEPLDEQEGGEKGKAGQDSDDDVAEMKRRERVSRRGATERGGERNGMQRDTRHDAKPSNEQGVREREDLSGNSRMSV